MIPASILQPPSNAVNVYAAYSHEPAPMGIADYGVGPTGAYQYATNSSLGSATIISLSTANATGDPWMSIQLNLDLQFSVSGKQYVYWAQDVAHIDTSARTIYFLDNIWNSSGYKANMAASGLSGSGKVYSSGTSSYYAVVASSSLPGNDVSLSYPAVVSFEINSSLDSSNRPRLTFGYNDGSGWQTYDTVSFNAIGKVALPGFEVNGFNYNPGGNFYDSELVLGGVCCGWQTSVTSSDVRLQLEYWNGHNYQLITNAYNFGSDTAEGISNTLSQWYYYTTNGGLIAEIKSGSGTLSKLWDQSGISIVDMKPGITTGILYVKNASNPSAVASQYPFTNDEVVVTLQPGYYTLTVYKSGSLYSTGSYGLTAGKTLFLPLPITKVPVTVSYSILGGGTGYSPPTLMYTSNGQTLSAVLGAAPTTFSVDTGSSWAVTSTLLGSSSIERWSTIQPTAGTASSNQTISLVYYHQFYSSFNFGITGGGSGYSGPVVTYATFGSATSTNSGTAVWVDASSSYTYSAVLAGSSSTQRWAATATSGTISSAAPVSVVYYHQFPIISSYSVVGGGTPPAPILSSVSFGFSLTQTLGATQQIVWTDSGASYALTNPLASSTSTERWQSTGTISGTVSGALSLSPVYYHQYSVIVSYGLVGGGMPTAPIFSYTSFATASSIPLGVSGITIWADSGSYGSTNPLAGSTSTERWYSTSSSGTITGSGSILITYHHQYYLSVTGGSVGSQWYDMASTALVTTPGVYGRSGGVGFRIASYAIDGGVATPLGPTKGNVTVSVVMNGPHALAFNAVRQEVVVLDSGATKALNSITQPTINGDDYWYDSGTPVQVILNGIWGRSSGTGSRLEVYTVNGGPATTVATAGTVTILSLTQISSPQSITTVFTSQFFLGTPTGSIASISLPPISGDVGWYDSGAQVKASYNNVWNATTEGTRLNAISYAIDTAAPSMVSRSGNGSFAVAVTMGSPHTISVKAATQYLLVTSGGSNVKVSVASPTRDDFFDAGTSIIVSTDYSWNVVNGNTRSNLLSYTLDGQTQRIARMESGTFLTPVINLTKPTELKFDSVPQYLITFSVTDRLGLTKIVPTTFEITVNGSVKPVPKVGMWFDNKSLIGVASVIWESAEVKPTTQNISTITGPGMITVRALVFPAKIAISDLFGLPVSGANVEVALANSTRVSGTTDPNGILDLGLIPIGTFQASVTNLGLTTQISGDATNREVVPGSIAVSAPTLTATITAFTVVSVFLVAMMVRRSRMRKSRHVEARQGRTPSRRATSPAH